MKKISIMSVGLCAALALASCGTSKESAYRKAFEKAQAQEAQQAQQAPVTTEPVVTPLETAPATQGARNMYRVVATTFADKANAVKSRNELRAGKYPDAWLLFKK